MMKSNYYVFPVILLLALITQTASGASINIGGQALPLNQGLPNQDSYNIRSDGVSQPSIEYDTGLLIGNRGGSARSAAGVDLQQGTLRIYTEINGPEVANATAGLLEGLIFDL